MKKKLKKLALAKETLRGLAGADLHDAAGGTDPGSATCNTNIFTIYTCDLNAEVCQREEVLPSVGGGFC